MILNFIKKWYDKYLYKTGYSSAKEAVKRQGWGDTYQETLSDEFNRETPKKFQQGYKAYLNDYSNDWIN